MYVDAPKCLKCCLCLPLRYSLAAWGYLKLIASVILLVVLSLDDGFTIVKSIWISVILVDTIFDFVLIVAAHMKHVKLFQCYYWYSIVILAVFILALVLATVYTGISYSEKFPPIIVSQIVIGHFQVLLGIVLIQVYITLLVRTEMIKLRDNCKIEFVNNAAESQCTVNVGIDRQVELKDDA